MTKPAPDGWSQPSIARFFSIAIVRMVELPKSTEPAGTAKVIA